MNQSKPILCVFLILFVCSICSFAQVWTDCNEMLITVDDFNTTLDFENQPADCGCNISGGGCTLVRVKMVETINGIETPVSYSSLNLTHPTVAGTVSTNDYIDVLNPYSTCREYQSEGQLNHNYKFSPVAPPGHELHLLICPGSESGPMQGKFFSLSPGTTLAAPTNVQASDGQTNISVTFDAIPGKYYMTYRSTENCNQSWTPIDPSMPWPQATSTSMTMTPNSFIPDQQFEYRVVASDNGFVVATGTDGAWSEGDLGHYGLLNSPYDSANDCSESNTDSCDVLYEFTSTDCQTVDISITPQFTPTEYAIAIFGNQSCNPTTQEVTSSWTFGSTLVQPQPLDGTKYCFDVGGVLSDGTNCLAFGNSNEKCWQFLTPGFILPIYTSYQEFIANNASGTDVYFDEPFLLDCALGYSIASSHAPGDFFEVGFTEIIHTVSDGGGNVFEYTQCIEVVFNDNDCTSDTEPPICLDGPFTVQLDSGQNYYTFDINDFATDVCASFLTYESAAIDVNSPNGTPGEFWTGNDDQFPCGTYVVDSAFPFDDNGNFNTCSFTFTVECGGGTTDPPSGDCCGDAKIYGSENEETPSGIFRINGATYILAQELQADLPYAFIAKYDDSNNLIWQTQLDTPSLLSDVISTGNNELILVGREEPVRNPNGFWRNNKSIIVKLNESTGSLVIANMYDFPGRESLTRIIKHSNPPNPNFPYYISGFSNANNTPTAQDLVRVANVNDNLNVNWYNSYPNTNDDQWSRDMKELPNGNLQLMGDQNGCQGILSEINALNGEIERVRETVSSVNFRNINSLQSGNLLLSGNTGCTSPTAAIILLNSTYEYLDAVNFDNRGIIAFEAIHLSSNESFYATGKMQNGELVIVKGKIMNESIIIDEFKVLKENETSYANSYVTLDGGNIYYTDGRTDHSEGLGMSDILLAKLSEGLSEPCLQDTTLAFTQFGINFGEIVINPVAQTFVAAEPININTVDFNSVDACRPIDPCTIDTIPPIVDCPIQTLTIEIQANGIASASFNDFNITAIDDCDTLVSINEVNFQLDCEAVGGPAIYQSVIATDDAGNSTQCEVGVQVIDPNLHCTSPDCDSITVDNSIIPNPDFEELTTPGDEPTFHSQLYKAKDWEQATTATSDFLSFSNYQARTEINPPMSAAMPPNGSDHYVGGLRTVGIEANGQDQIEYIGACLNSSLLEGQYSLNMLIGAPSESFQSKPVLRGEIVVLGIPNCNFPISGRDCKEDEFDELGRIPIELPELTWQNYNIILNVAPTKAYEAIMFGLSCSTDGSDNRYYFLADDLILQRGNPCEIDDCPPICQTMDITVGLDQDGLLMLSPDDINNNSYDQCSEVSLSINQDSFSCDEIGSNIVELTVTDEAGNTSSCSANVTIVDLTNPTCLVQPINLALDQNGQASISPQMIDAGSADECSDVMLEIDIDNFNCNDIGENEVTLFITDASGNSSSCRTIVMVEDKTDPICAVSDITVSLDNDGFFTVSPQQIDAGSADECGDVILSILGNDTFGCDDLATTQEVILLVTDQSDNTSTCSSKVEVIDLDEVCIDPCDNDTTPPTVACPALPITLSLDNNGLASIGIAELGISAADNCPGKIRYDFSQSIFTCVNIGQNSIIVTVHDESGNATECPVNINIIDNDLVCDDCDEDTTPPVVICSDFVVGYILDENGQATINPSLHGVDAFDDCGIEQILSEIPVLTCDDLTSTPQSINIFVNDLAGNTSTCNISYILLDPNNYCIPTECPVDCYTGSINLSTGVDINGAELPIGQYESNWQLISGPDQDINYPRPGYVLNPNAVWDQLPGSQYISPFPNASNNQSFSDPYIFERCFCVCQEEAVVQLDIAAHVDNFINIGLYDDQGNEIQELIDYQNPPDTGTFLDPAFTSNSSHNLLSGTYCLRAGLRNDGSATMGMQINAAVTNAGFEATECCNPNAFLLGTVFEDMQCDSILNNNQDTGLEGLEVSLLQNNAIIETTTTDVYGYYVFSNVEEGDYTVEVETPTNANPSIGAGGIMISLNANSTIGGIDFGFCFPDDMCCGTDIELEATACQNITSASIEFDGAEVSITEPTLESCQRINQIFWGDGEFDQVIEGDPLPTHDYSLNGTWIISVEVLSFNNNGEVCNTSYVDLVYTINDCVVNVDDPILDLARFKVFPVPFNEFVELQFNNNSNGFTGNLLDMTGALVRDITVQGGIQSFTLDTQDLIPAVYTIRLTENNTGKQLAARIIKVE